MKKKKICKIPVSCENHQSVKFTSCFLKSGHPGPFTDYFTVHLPVFFITRHHFLPAGVGGFSSLGMGLDFHPCSEGGRSAKFCQNVRGSSFFVMDNFFFGQNNRRMLLSRWGIKHPNRSRSRAGFTRARFIFSVFSRPMCINFTFLYISEYVVLVFT